MSGPSALPARRPRLSWPGRPGDADGPYDCDGWPWDRPFWRLVNRQVSTARRGERLAAWWWGQRASWRYQRVRRRRLGWARWLVGG